MIEKYINTIKQGDCLALFKGIPDDSVDITFADPPFNLGKKYTSYEDSVDRLIETVYKQKPIL